MTNAFRCLILLAFIAVPSMARADPFDDSMDAGELAFKNKDYPKARAEFQKAYDIRPEPLPIYNIAQTYRFEGNAKRAIE